MPASLLIALSSRPARTRLALGALLLVSLQAGCNDLVALPDAGLDAGSRAPHEPAASAFLDAGLDGAAHVSAADAEQATAPIPPERAALCARPADDAVRDIFCKGARLSVSSLRELEARLGLDALPVDMSESEAALVQVDPTRQVDTAVLLGHSTALSGQLVSPINPRAILIGKSTFLAFQRGVQKVEIATADRQTGRRNFYLITFAQACNEQASGCMPGDLYTLQIERDWRAVTLRDDEDLKNTPLDCRMCHQRKRDTPALLMRELIGPWTHFFFPDSDRAPYDPEKDHPGRVLTREYRRAKGDESYAGLAPAVLRMTGGFTLQNALREFLQPLQFPPTIEDQVKYNAVAGKPARSQVWDELYANFKRGRHLPLPYFTPNPADPGKLAALGDAYARYRRGELAAEALPDLADVFPDDPQARAEIGLSTEPAASPAELLVQACGSCHNDVLDQSVSRARFSVRLARMSREELDLAIARIELPGDREGVMPPHGMRQLDAGGRARLLAYLRENVRSAEDDALLEDAARVGMAEEVTGY
jgi:hypothetical protein